jgi:TatD DNase family protein
MKLFDSHCHLQLSQFDADRDAAISRMVEKQMGGVVIGTDLLTSKGAVELAEKYDFLWAVIGLHPNDNLDEEFDEAGFEALVKNPKVVAIGECGLDYFRSGGTPEPARPSTGHSGGEKSAQEKRFRLQMELAARADKTLVIHCRNAHDDMLELLKEFRKGSGGETRIIIHFFTGSGELAQKYLDLGCYLSFPGPITYTDMYDESIRVAPMDRMLSETDSPFAAPVPFCGKRNEPVYVEYVVAKIAAIKNIPVEEVAAQIVLNSQQVFNIDS